MSNYTEYAASCRVDFFKSSGKWYCTEAVKFVGPWRASVDSTIHDVFKQSLREHFKDTPSRLQGMVAVCLMPYHEHTHPLMVTSW